jgi:nucleotide-binding universal stress UspA family protein
MLPIHTILHPTDFSEQSGHALHFAAGLARDYGARLVVLHAAEATPLGYFEGASASDPEAPIRAARQRFEQLDVPHVGASVERRFEVGDPTESILRIAAEIRADLIVMGTHGRTGLERFLMGSVAEQVVRRAPCPVLTMTAPYAAAEEPVAALAAAVC